MKKVFITIIMLSFLTVTLVGKYNLKSGITSTTFTSMLLNESLTEDLVEKYFSSNQEVKKQAEKNIKQIVVRELGHNQWLEYLDYIEISIYPTDIVNDEKKELIIAVNLSKNMGIVSIYTLENKNYKLDKRIENLASIKNIEVKRNDTSDKRFLMIEEFLDQSIGAYFTDNFFRIFTEIDGVFKEVFRESLNYKALYYERWSEPSIKKPKWLRVSEENVVDYIPNLNNYITVVVSKKLEKYEAKDNIENDIPKNFNKVEEKNFNIKYIWNEKYKHFIQGEGEVVSSKEKVGIIEDSSKTADQLLNLGDKYYKVINENSGIEYIKQDQINILKDYTK